MTVAPADEAQCLGKLLGKRRQLSGALGEILDGAQLLGRCGRNRLGLLAGGLRAFQDLADSSVAPLARSWMARNCSDAAAATASASWLEVCAPVRACPRE